MYIHLHEKSIGKRISVFAIYPVDNRGSLYNGDLCYAMAASISKSSTVYGIYVQGD